MFSCKQVLTELGGFIDGELDPEMRRHVESHLASCRTCRVLYDSTKKTIKVVTESRSFVLTEDVSKRVVRQIMDKVAKKKNAVAET